MLIISGAIIIIIAMGILNIVLVAFFHLNVLAFNGDSFRIIFVGKTMNLLNSKLLILTLTLFYPLNTGQHSRGNVGVFTGIK
jgi:hypothetical protein